MKTIKSGLFLEQIPERGSISMTKRNLGIDWLREKAAIEDENLLSVGGLVSKSEVTSIEMTTNAEHSSYNNV